MGMLCAMRVHDCNFTSSKGRGPMQALNMVRLLLNDLLKRFARPSLLDLPLATFPPSTALFMAIEGT